MAKADKRKGVQKRKKRTSLSPRERVFVQEYLVDLNAARAARDAGYAPSTAEAKAAMWVKDRSLKPMIFDAVQEGMANRSSKLEITQEQVLAMWWKVATADPAEIMKVKKGSCRHCHGENFLFQWINMEEFAAQTIKNLKMGKPAPSKDGGFGYSPARPPHPNCPSCWGEGYDRIVVADTESLSEGGRALYDGVSQTESGRMKIHIRSRENALREVGKHIGFYNADKSGKDDMPNPLRILLQQISGNALGVVSDDPDYHDDET